MAKSGPRPSATELEAVAEQARSLREWFRGFVLAHKGRPLDESDIDQLGPLNRLLERDDAFGRSSPPTTAARA